MRDAFDYIVKVKVADKTQQDHLQKFYTWYLSDKD